MSLITVPVAYLHCKLGFSKRLEDSFFVRREALIILIGMSLLSIIANGLLHKIVALVASILIFSIYGSYYQNRFMKNTRDKS
ncbi:hypothetical protein [Acidovorax sp. 100]|uniref:hypothetical protein n=1 Tax=Acidovorax sp. 100 TaxID=2135635 RepID=UPI0011C496F5|nr:hypothetical protein [Acidovorax sp. 100]